MENVFDLDEYSNKEDNSENSEEIKNNSQQNIGDIQLSSCSVESDQYSNKKESIQEQISTFDINEISSNPINVSPLKLNNSSEKIKICDNLKISNNETEIQKDSLIKYAIEDDIDISKFDEIKEPAMKFEFVLDNFQKRSIIRLEQKENILVCAHTSSGKTVVAEYGIALGKKNNQKVIYTSPIKALSNQKYREFKKKFKDVGIITGDVNINPEAQCLIITTEILHKFLYSQSSILKQVGTIVFDEVHYINDNERGHIWEEILIVLPNYISIIMLSATIPNYYEFGCWVGKIKNTKLYIELTKNRVVPLQYFLYIDNNSIFKVKDKENIINEGEIDKAFSYLKKIKAPKYNENSNLNLNEKKNNFSVNENSINSDNENNSIREELLSSNSDLEENEGNEINDEENNKEEEVNENKNGNCIYKKERPHKKNIKKKILEIIKYLLNNKLYPATLFIFNIKKIQEYSNMLIKNNNLPEMPNEEKEIINNFFNATISSLPIEEQKITQINYIRQLLQYGIGVHHSGLLPILKELIEILYYHGHIKILFATTSFSIGLNMPTRTVVFTSLYKFHERKSQMLNSSEFLQMCGRAGRRGIDEYGNIFIVYAYPPGKTEVQKFKKILTRQGNDLESKFRLSYRIILSFYYRNLKNIKDFFTESFHESHNIERKPERLKEINKLTEELRNKNGIKCLKNKKKNRDNCSNEIICDIEDSPIGNLICNTDRYDSINKKIYNNKKILEYLNEHPGTILKVKNNSSSSINKLEKSDLVMLIKILSLQDKKKLWCLTITSHDDNKKNQMKDNNNHSSNNKEDSKSKEKEQKDSTIPKNKDQYKGYKYKYLVLDFNDIIEIYDNPRPNIEPFFKEEKIDNSFDITDKGYYYFKRDDQCLYWALRLFYREIINFFPKKANDIKTKKSKNKNNNHITELKKVRILDCKKIIDCKIGNNDIFLEKKKLHEKIKNNCCYNCPYYQKHLLVYKEICAIKEKINTINNEIIKGEKKETIKLFNKRLCVLKELEFIETEDNEIIENVNGITNFEEEKYNNYSLTLKGRASLEIISNDCVLLTEILMSNIFINKKGEFQSEIIIPFLSSFSINTKMQDLKTEIKLEDNNINDEINNLMSNFRTIYDEIFEKEKKFDLKENMYNRSFCFKYFLPVYFYMKGDNFCEVCSKNEIVEGKLYSIIMRTFYLLGEIINFYKKVENNKMATEFEKIKNNLLKGIMCVESLYLQEKINIDII
jgi:antiviral helicase SKI2